MLNNLIENGYKKFCDSAYIVDLIYDEDYETNGFVDVKFDCEIVVIDGKIYQFHIDCPYFHKNAITEKFNFERKQIENFSMIYIEEIESGTHRILDEIYGIELYKFDNKEDILNKIESLIKEYNML